LFSRPVFSEQPHALVLVFNDQAIAIILDLMNPNWTGWFYGLGGTASKFRNMPVTRWNASEEKTASAGS
jgi:hypothetical protein